MDPDEHRETAKRRTRFRWRPRATLTDDRRSVVTEPAGPTVLAVERWKLNVGCSKFVLLLQAETNVQRSTLNIEQTCPHRSRLSMKHYAENHAEKRFGIDNLLQIHRLQLREARKSGSNDFPAGSGGFPARWGGFQSRSRGFPTGSNRFRSCIYNLFCPEFPIL